MMERVNLLKDHHFQAMYAYRFPATDETVWRVNNSIHRFDRQSVASSGSCTVESHLNAPPIAVPVHVDLLTDVTRVFTSREVPELHTADDQLALLKTRRQ